METILMTNTELLAHLKQMAKALEMNPEDPYVVQSIIDGLYALINQLEAA